MRDHVDAERWDELLAKVTAFWSAEDRMVAEALGPETAEAHRQADLRGRTALAAIRATCAGRDWDDSLAPAR